MSIAFETVNHGTYLYPAEKQKFVLHPETNECYVRVGRSYKTHGFGWRIARLPLLLLRGALACFGITPRKLVKTTFKQIKTGLEKIQHCTPYRANSSTFKLELDLKPLWDSLMTDELQSENAKIETGTIFFHLKGPLGELNKEFHLEKPSSGDLKLSTFIGKVNDAAGTLVNNLDEKIGRLTHVKTIAIVKSINSNFFVSSREEKGEPHLQGQCKSSFHITRNADMVSKICAVTRVNLGITQLTEL